MRRVKFLYYISIAALIAVGVLFVKANRYKSTISMVSTIKDKIIVMYSSNFKRMYEDSKQRETGDMAMLCIEGVSLLKDGGLNSVYLRLGEGTEDPYTLSGLYLEKNLDKKYKYVLIDISRAQTKYGRKYDIANKVCCPISMIISKKSTSYDDTLLFAGRIKSIIDKKYGTLPVHIITVDDGDYNQSMGSMGMTVEIGDAANTYDEARECLRIFCSAVLELAGMER
ncbi:MAG TPA: hypothetical protein DD429_10940 [Clostridiaceae bacterium]|nr:hypothetical protein [Clostridiaceae bacterium]